MLLEVVIFHDRKYIRAYIVLLIALPSEVLKMPATHRYPGTSGSE
jgi:hypothetical protein